MTFEPQNGLHWTAEENWTKHSFSFLKLIIFVDLERKKEFHDGIANYNIKQRFAIHQNGFDNRYSLYEGHIVTENKEIAFKYRVFEGG